MKWRSWWLFPPAEREAATKRSAPNKKESIRCAPFFLPKFGLWYYYCRWWPMALMKLDQSQKQVAHWAFFFSGKKKKYSPFFYDLSGQTHSTQVAWRAKKKRKRRRNPDCWWLFLLASPTSSITAANWGFTFWIFLSVRKILLKVTQRTPEKRDVQLQASRLCSFD